MTDHPMYQGVKFPQPDIDEEPALYPKMKYISQPEFPEMAKPGTHYKIVNNEEEEAEFDKKYPNAQPMKSVKADPAPDANWSKPKV